MDFNLKNATTSHQIPAKNHKEISISHKHGVIVLDSTHDESHEFRSWGRRMAYYKESDQVSFLVPDYHQGGHKKRHNQSIRKNARFLKSLLNDEGPIINFGDRDNYLRISTSPNDHKMVSAEVRDEVYWPVTFFHKNNLHGSIYANIWRCCTVQQSTQMHVTPLTEKPVTSVVTGMCMFGTNIIGIDQFGHEHPLTNTSYCLPPGAVLEKVRLNEESLHPYESMMLRLFDNQIPMLKALGNGRAPTIYYQSVFEEYSLYGINTYLRGEMTRPALDAYVEHVRIRTEHIRRLIGQVCEKHDVEWDMGRSTLRALFENLPGEEPSSTGNMIDDFLFLLKIDVPLINSLKMADRLHHIKGAVLRCIRRLASQPGNEGEVWSHISRHVFQEQSDGIGEHHYSSLLSVNFLNYAAKVAIVRKSTPHGEVCLAHPFHEKAMALSYREIHADEFGPILAINWIPPIFSHISFKDGLYYLDDHKTILNELIDNGIVESCVLELGAQLTGNADIAKIQQHRIKHLLDSLPPQSGKKMPSTSALAQPEPSVI